jgi:uncharacterized damage-inducible protein DinB
MLRETAVKSPNPLFDAVDYAVSVLQQVEVIAEAAILAPQVNYGCEVGPHLRHVVEHFQQLMRGITLGSVNYDSREREVSLERDITVLRARLNDLIVALEALQPQDLDATVEVLLLGRLDGSVQFSAPSTVLRELLFVTSHATHHYALLVNLLRAHGVALPVNFGKAPATAQHERPTELKLGAIA